MMSPCTRTLCEWVCAGSDTWLTMRGRRGSATSMIEVPSGGCMWPTKAQSPSATTWPPPGMSSLERWRSSGMSAPSVGRADANMPMLSPHQPFWRPRPELSHMLRLALALGRGKLIELFLGHRFVHRFRGAFQVADLLLAALGRERGACRLLLCFGFRRHRRCPLLFTRSTKLD